MTSMTITVGGDIDDDGAAIAERVLSFESWEGLARVLTGERFRLLRHVHASPAPTISALARSLDRQYRRVHADVTALEQAELLERSADGLRTTADRMRTEIRL
jgi:predicted transcriptional regulator